MRLLGVVLLGLLVAVLVGIAGNDKLRWHVVGEYLFNPAILAGVLVTLELAVLSQLIAIVLGGVAAYWMQSGNPVLKALSGGYIWFFRGTPILVQLLFWYNLALLLPTIRIGIPFTGLGAEWTTNTLITGFTAALLGLSFNEGAYMAEVVRAGILSVPRGQTEAALSIGMRRNEALRRIVVPQTIRVIIPPTGNQFITLIKGSSLVAVIGGGDLLTRAQFIYGQTYEVIPLLIVACIWYLLIVSVASIGQYFLERRFDYESRSGRVTAARTRLTASFR
ncbi:amino acid ABC transporter permease protein [Pseudonocardia sp. N23]|nr:amino acid ABC transporter permease protein [Pseudonocardia sp. N23]